MTLTNSTVPASSKKHSVNPLVDGRTVLVYLSVVSIVILFFPFGRRVWKYVLEKIRLSFRPQIFLDEDDVDRDQALGQEQADGPSDGQPTAAPPRFLSASGGSLWADLKAHVELVGGWVDFSANALRLVGFLSLLALSIASAVLDSEVVNHEDGSKVGVSKHKNKNKKEDRVRQAFGREEWVEIGQCCVFFYLSLLSLLSLTVTKPAMIRRIDLHLIVITLVGLMVYAIRNVLPAMLGEKPMDIGLHPPHGKHQSAHLEKYSAAFLWTRLAILGVVGVILPVGRRVFVGWNRPSVRLDEASSSEQV
ncbi:hypothetical protein [Phaffia rhodozyma]|uniref:Uncharacterized protein n=1 Tax=Phaffia rhodozyma TaxID=264483 RepID=A0A0F7SXU6_PHARH|nr:hypothetical protein [Phaffia rhodozyma]